MVTPTQQLELGTWALFSVGFGLVSYTFVVFDTGPDPRRLFGDGSLILVGVGLAVAAGATAFDEGITRLKQHWLWFGAIALVLLLGAGAYATARADLRSASEPIEPPSIAEALVANEQARRGSGRGVAMTSSDEFEILRDRLAQLLRELVRAEQDPDRESAVVREQDAVESLLGEVRDAESRLDGGRRSRIVDAERFATLAGAVMVVAGLVMGATVVLKVNE